MRLRPSRGVASALAMLAMVLGGFVILGWHLRVPRLVQVLPGFVPMQYNTALGFVLGGGAMLCLAREQSRRVAVALATTTLLLGGLTGLQYVLQIDLRIDELWMAHDITTKTSHPGRMAPNTAVCFVLCGGAALLTDRPGRGFRPPPSALGAAIAMGLSSVALIGYVAQVETAYGWANLTRMAVHTAVGFVVLGASTLALMWPARASRGWMPRWIVALVVVAGVSASAAASMAVEANRVRSIDRATETALDGLSDELRRHIQHHHLALRRMQERWESEGGTPEERWRADAANYHRDMPGLQAIEWVDANHIVRWVVPLVGNEAAVGLDLTSEPQRRAALMLADQRQRAAVTSPVMLRQGGLGFMIFAPLTRDAKSEGHLLGVVRTHDFLEPLVERVVGSHHVALSLQGVPVYTNGAVSGGPRRKSRRSNLLDVEWGIAMEPTGAALADGSGAPEITLGISLALTIMLALLLHFAIVARTRAAKLEDAHDGLEREVAARTMELAQTNRLLSNSNEELGHFAYLASHDLREPLRTAASFAQLLERRYEDQIDEKGRRWLERVVDATTRMGALLDGLLSMSRVDLRTPEHREVDLNDVVDDVCADLEIAIAEAHASIRFDTLPEVFGDPIQLRQLLQNLVANALKFNTNGAPIVELSAEPNDVGWTITVADNGIGIAPEHQERVFQLFKRLHNREKFGGTGLGLAIAKKIVQRHGGEIWVDTAPTTGATIHFTLPAAPATARPAPAESRA